MKLHLGCGQRYLEGYHNIDYPTSKHTVLKRLRADQYADIRTLKYPKSTVDEIRLHHVFEHFPRPVACGLLVSWRSWLKEKGILRIEVPDFDRSVVNILKPRSGFNKRAVSLRHIFGSNEADWAVHFEGWSGERLKKIFKLYGYRTDKISNNSWKSTHNVEIIGIKTGDQLEIHDYEKITEDYLSNFLVDQSISELKLREVWMGDYNDQIRKSYSS